jgi:membrane protein YqaA with SNARE-associated domain
MTKARSAVEWVVIVLVSLAIAGGAIALLSGYFRVASPSAAPLRRFIQYWLGRGAPNR